MESFLLNKIVFYWNKVYFLLVKRWIQENYAQFTNYEKFCFSILSYDTYYVKAVWRCEVELKFTVHYSLFGPNSEL